MAIVVDDDRFFVLLSKYREAKNADQRSTALCSIARLVLSGPRDEARAARRFLIETQGIQLGRNGNGEAELVFLDRRR